MPTASPSGDRLQLGRQHAKPVFSSCSYLAPDKEKDNRAEDRHDNPGGMERCSGLRFGKEPADQAADDGSGNAEYGRQDESHVLSAGQNRAGDKSDDEAEND